MTEGMNLMKCSAIFVALRELEIILEGFQGVEQLAGAAPDMGHAVSSSMVPLNLFFEENLSKLKVGISALELNSVEATTNAQVEQILKSMKSR